MNNIEVIVMESSDSESEIDVINCSDDENTGENYDSDSSESFNGENRPVAIGPVLSLRCLHEDDFQNEDSNSLPLKIVAVSGAPSSPETSQPQSSIPSRNSWEGAHNFKVTIQSNDLPKKSDNAIFSELHNKLYVSKDYPLKVLVYAENVPSGSRIRVSAVFAMAEHSYEVVKRCPTHAQVDFVKGNPAYEHFVQSFSNAALYSKNLETGKLCVSVPYEEPQEGETYTSYLFKLTCFSSCSGGINRRPFLLVFSLENENGCLGKQAIEAKVCACPQRDYKVDQDRPNKSGKRARSVSPNKSSAEERQIKPRYTITVKDPDLFSFLKQMKYFYEFTSKFKTDEDSN